MSLAALVGVGLICTVILLSYLGAGDVYDFQDTVDGVHLPPVDAIVCLAGGRGRVSAAADIWYRYAESSPEKGGRSPLPILYLSGMGHQTHWGGVSKMVRRGVLQKLRSENVIIEKESSNTDTNARWLVFHAKRHGWKRVLLMTSSYHMKRAKFILEQVLKNEGQDIQVDTLSVYQEPFAPDEWRTDVNGIRVTLLEYFKWLYYRSFWTL